MASTCWGWLYAGYLPPLRRPQEIRTEPDGRRRAVDRSERSGSPGPAARPLRVTCGSQPLTEATLRRGSDPISASVNRSVTHAPRENSAVWSLKCGDDGLADSE